MNAIFWGKKRGICLKGQKAVIIQRDLRRVLMWTRAKTDQYKVKGERVLIVIKISIINNDHMKLMFYEKKWIYQF